jgi:hypothetical protein
MDLQLLTIEEQEDEEAYIEQLAAEFFDAINYDEGC